LNWVSQSLADNPRVAEDARQLKRVLKCNPAELCKRQCQR
jgi:hypothetical protein